MNNNIDAALAVGLGLGHLGLVGAGLVYLGGSRAAKRAARPMAALFALLIGLFAVVCLVWVLPACATGGIGEGGGCTSPSSEWSPVTTYAALVLVPAFALAWLATRISQQHQDA